MKKLIQGALVAATLLAAAPGMAQARPWHDDRHHHHHQTCMMRHHHRVCMWR